MEYCGFQFDNSYLRLPDSLYSRAVPSPVNSPKLVILNESLASAIGLDFSKLSSDDKASLFSGNIIPQDTEPFSQAYAGHQFGYFTILGDGRAHILGEHIAPDKQRFDIQFKGTGRTPYSRRGDGRAALGPMLREYIISEAMHHLGVMTTRSLAVVATGETVLRDTKQAGAILTRVASSHLRIGTFEFCAKQSDQRLLNSVTDYTIERHFPELTGSNNKALALLDAVMEKQATLIVDWMRIGFIHGVMNTDNMALSGETIDYGPCAFMDEYDPSTVFSSIDDMGRYAYANQPIIAQWNLARFAETLLPLIHDDLQTAVSMAKERINHFTDIYQMKWLAMMRSKLGLFGSHMSDQQLISDLLEWMHKNHADYTNTFRHLSQEKMPNDRAYQDKQFNMWYHRWQNRLAKNTEPFQSSINLMQKNNPVVIPRNHKVEQALEAANTDSLKPFLDLVTALQQPYQDQDHLNPYKAPPKPNERVYQTFCGT